MKTKSNLWKLSPSSLYTYTECKSCFWVENHFKRAPMLPLRLNSAMDGVLKSRYDKYRSKKAFPPEAKELKKEGIKPFTDLEKLELWRSKSSSLEVKDEKAGYVLRGKIDDVLVEKDGRLIPADYKSSGDPPKPDKQKYYRDQLAAYGLMFARHGFEVSDRAYLLHYYVADWNDPSLEVRFAGEVDLVRINVRAIERKLREMVRFLNGPYPGSNDKCEKCAYYEDREKIT